jgi:hypothetical protein
MPGISLTAANHFGLLTVCRLRRKEKTASRSVARFSSQDVDLIAQLSGRGGVI